MAARDLSTSSFVLHSMVQDSELCTGEELLCCT